MTVRNAVRWGLLAITLGWLAVDAPLAWWREIQFVLEILLVTAATRTVTWQHASAALAMGIGLAAPLMVGVGWLLSWIGLDVTDSAAGWTIVPVLEEVVKLLPVGLIAGLYRRQRRQSLNPSDWLLMGCAAGAGFALVENIELVLNNAGVMRDMARQYGPHVGSVYLVPGAWGVAGFVGHAAATGMAAAGIGLSLAVKRRGATRRAAPLALLRQIPAPWWAIAVAAFGWVTVEHALANLSVDTGASIARILGNGRLTPWLAVALFALVIAVDVAHRRAALAHSAIFRMHFALIRAAWNGAHVAVRRTRLQIARIYFNELRRLNAAAWATFDTRPS